MLPRINIKFHERGITAIRRGERGIVALILESATQIQPTEVTLVSEIPSTLNKENKQQIELALRGYRTPPKKVIVQTIPVKLLTDDADYTAAQNHLETVRFDYVAIPQIADAQVDGFATWIKGLRDTKKIKVKAVLPSCNADHEGIINFTADNIVTKEKTYTTAEYCGRIAGMIAGTPLNISCTYAPLPEVLDCDKFTQTELDTKVDNGELVLYNDGEKIKIGRGVNSFVTTSEGKGNSYKKIKIVEALDLINDDITKEIEDSYIGKYSNSYDNKCLLIVAIKTYLEELERVGILNEGHTHLGIDLVKQIQYLNIKDYIMPDGRKPEAMSDLEIKKADTGDKVFLDGGLKVLDAIEDIDLDLDI